MLWSFLDMANDVTRESVLLPDSYGNSRLGQAELAVT
jgi:hypothetical protein